MTILGHKDYIKRIFRESVLSTCGFIPINSDLTVNCIIVVSSEENEGEVVVQVHERIEFHADEKPSTESNKSSLTNAELTTNNTLSVKGPQLTITDETENSKQIVETDSALVTVKTEIDECQDANLEEFPDSAVKKMCCSSCYKEFSTAYEYQNHNYLIHSLYTCKYCMEVFSGQEDLLCHVKGHVDSIPDTGDKHDNPISSTKVLKQELKEKKTQTNMSLDYGTIPKLVYDKAALGNEGVSNQNLTGIEDCGRCDARFCDSNKDAHRLNTFDTRDVHNYQCSLCGYRAKHRHDFQLHLRNHSATLCENNKYRLQSIMASKSLCEESLIDNDSLDLYNRLKNIPHNTETIRKREEKVVSSSKAISLSKPNSKDNGRNTCDHCQMRFVKEIDLLAHLYYYHNKTSNNKTNLTEQPMFIDLDETVNRIKYKSSSNSNETNFTNRDDEHSISFLNDCVLDLSVKHTTYAKPPVTQENTLENNVQIDGRKIKPRDIPMVKESKPHSPELRLATTRKRSFSMITAPRFSPYHTASRQTFSDSDIMYNENTLDLDQHKAGIPSPRNSHPETICGNRVEDAVLAESLQVYKHAKSFRCDYCPDIYATYIEYANHCGSKHKRFICDYCGMTFTSKPNRDRHRRYHTGEKPYICGVCSKSFYRGDDLKYHQTTRHLMIAKT